MNQFNFGFTHPPFLAATRPGLVTTQPETQQPDAIAVPYSFWNEATSASVGFLVLLSSFILLCCSMRRWKTPEIDAAAADIGDRFWTDGMTLDVPCTHCHYFKANRYLPCAVNPLQALTVEARNCGEFREKEMSQ